MRIAYVSADPGVPVFGRKGASVHAQGVLGALARAGAAVELFTARPGGQPPPALAGIRVHDLGRPARADAAGRERALLAMNTTLRDRLAAGGPFDLVYERHALFAWSAMESARDVGAPGILEVNAPLVEEQAAHRVLVDRAAAEHARRRALGAAHAILAVSRVLARELVRHPYARDKVHVVPNAVDPARFAPRGTRATAEPFTVAFVGTLKPWHGLETLADAFAGLREVVPEARLLVVGDGPGREGLEERLRTAGMSDAAVLTGSVTPAAVGPLLASADVAVAPYPPTAAQYFSPLKVFEAMAAGLPVVGARVGQLPELIQDGDTGVLCAAGDVGAFVDALAGLAADPARRRRIGAAARAQVLREHTWDHVAHRILAIAGASVEAAA